MQIHVKSDETAAFKSNLETAMLYLVTYFAKDTAGCKSLMSFVGDVLSLREAAQAAADLDVSELP